MLILYCYAVYQDYSTKSSVLVQTCICYWILMYILSSSTYTARAGKSSPSTNTTKWRTPRVNRKRRKSLKANANGLDRPRRSLSSLCGCLRSRSVTIAPRVGPVADHHDPDPVRHLLSSRSHRHPPNKRQWRAAVAEKHASILGVLHVPLVRRRFENRRRQSVIVQIARTGSGKSIKIGVEIAFGKLRCHRRPVFCKWYFVLYIRKSYTINCLFFE